MGYVVAGYTIVLGILFLYGLDLVWRRRRLTRAVGRVQATDPGPDRDPSAPGVEPGPVDPLAVRR
jgi:hypothetical protein